METPTPTDPGLVPLEKGVWISSLIKISDNELVIKSSDFKLMLYNSSTNKWSQLFDYSNLEPLKQET